MKYENDISERFYFAPFAELGSEGVSLGEDGSGFCVSGLVCAGIDQHSKFQVAPLAPAELLCHDERQITSSTDEREHGEH